MNQKFFENNNMKLMIKKSGKLAQGSPAHAQRVYTQLDTPLQLGTTVPSTFVPWKKSGIFPSDRGIFPMGTGIKLDLCFCIIPTVGLYRKLEDVSISFFITIN